MMKKQYIYSALILTALLTAGCAKEFENPADSADSSAIELSSVSTDPMTKAVITGTEFTTTEAAAGIGLFLLDGSGKAYGSNKPNVKYTFSSSKWTADSPLRAGGTSGMLYGYYPYSEGVTDISAIPVASSIDGTDYLYATPVEVNSSNAKSVSLSLSHALARVSLSFKLDESYEGSGALSSISLSGDCVAASGTLNAKTGGIVADASKFSAETNQTLSKTASTTLECLVVPVSIESGTPELRIACTIDGKAYATTFTGNLAALAPGKQTTIELTVQNTSLTVDGSSIGAWGDGGTQTVTVGGDYKVTIAYSSDSGIKDDVWIKNVEVVDNSVVVTARSNTGKYLKCTMPDGEFCTSQSKEYGPVHYNYQGIASGYDYCLYTFTISDIAENTTATIGYAKAVSSNIIAVLPANAGCKVTIKEVDLYEGETVRLVPEAEYRYGISCWKEQNGNLLSDGYDYTVRLSQDLQITACFEENLVLGGEFSVKDGQGQVKKVRFTRGNMYHDHYYQDKGCRIEQLQYESTPSFDSARDNRHISHFMWCRTLDEARKILYEETGASDSDALFTNQSTFTVYGFEAGDCFTLSDWTYLLNMREASTVNGTENARYFKGCIQKEDGTSMDGLFIFPDVFTWPSSVKTQPSGINEASAGYTNSYTYNDFKRLQDAGIVFLPAAGFRDGYGGDSSVSLAGSAGYYWSASSSGNNLAFDLSFTSGPLDPSYSDYRGLAYSVRLVTESQSEPSAE